MNTNGSQNKEQDEKASVFRFLLDKTKDFFKRFFYIIGLVWQAAPFLLVFMCILCILDGVLPVVGAYISKDLLNEIARLIEQRIDGEIAGEIFVVLKPLIFLFSMYIIYNFINKIMGRISGMVTGVSGELVVNHIKLMIVEKAKNLDLRSYDSPEFYEKLENANREAGVRPIGILNASFAVISSVISAISFIVVLTQLSPFAPLIIILAAVPGALINFMYRNRNYKYIKTHSKERRKMNYYTAMMVSKDRAKEIKVLGLGDTFISKYKQVFKGYYKGLKRLILKEGITQIIISLLSTVVSCGLFFYVAYNVIFKDGMIGDYSLYSGALTSIAGYITTLLTATATIYEGTLFIDNMITFMNEDVKVTSTANPPLIPSHGVPHKVEFKNVSFSYPGTERKVLKNLNLTLNPGESCVLVGLNGAGKTTLIKLLTRLYDPTEGTILLDGHDIREYDTKELYNMFGIIFQDFCHYAETARENIEFGDINREHTDEAVIEASIRGNSKEFIDRMPMNYETPLTRVFEEDGIELSGGQWQKLSVSRAFYKNSEILILDEPTAALDPMAEQDLFTRFNELSKGKITLFVSHRLSSAVSASKIIVLDGGEIAEEGNHEELMKLHGKYFNLFTVQAKRYTGVDYNDPNNTYAQAFMQEKAEEGKV